LQFTKANKKRQTTLTLPAQSTVQDMLKENKVTSLLNSSQSSQLLTKTQSLSQGPKILGTKTKPIGKIQAFSKKDINLTSAKKKKVLCEATSTTGTATGTGLVNQIPRKKIKVSNLNINLSLKGETASIVHTSAQNPDSQLAKYFLTSTKTLDDEMIPCCSKFLTKAPSSPSGSSSGSTNSGNQVKITSFLPIKKMTKNRKLKFSSRPRIGLKKLRVENIDESQSNALLRENCASTSAPSSKLLKKKKRSLKSLKKPLLH
jgi:hypothetical protein